MTDRFVFEAIAEVLAISAAAWTLLAVFIDMCRKDRIASDIMPSPAFFGVLAALVAALLSRLS